jgi:hypothetical protein
MEKISPIIVTLKETMIDGAQLSAMLFAKANERHQQVLCKILYHYYSKLQQQERKLRSVSSIGAFFPLFYLVEDFNHFDIILPLSSRIDSTQRILSSQYR